MRVNQIRASRCCGLPGNYHKALSLCFGLLSCPALSTDTWKLHTPQGRQDTARLVSAIQTGIVRMRSMGAACSARRTKSHSDVDDRRPRSACIDCGSYRLWYHQHDSTHGQSRILTCWGASINAPADGAVNTLQSAESDVEIAELRTITCMMII